MLVLCPHLARSDSKYVETLKRSRALKEVLFPGNSGYYAQTGGNLENLRDNTTIEKVTCFEDNEKLNHDKT